jgi:hypothetical protein
MESGEDMRFLAHHARCEKGIEHEKGSKVLMIGIGALLLATATSVFAQQTDNAGCKDFPLFTRMPGYWTYNCKQSPFDARAFEVGQGKKTEVEGQFWEVTYYPNRDLTAKPSDLQITRNFANAVEKLGGSVVWSRKGSETLKLDTDGQEIWITERPRTAGWSW